MSALDRAMVPRFRAVVLLLTAVYVEPTQHYLPGWTDALVAATCGVRDSFAAQVRDEAFGLAATANALWRQRQAVHLLAQHFDHLARMTLIDASAADIGAVRLEQAQLRGVGPAFGRYAPGWTDDKIAEVCGVGSGDVYALRSTIAWSTPETRPRRRRWAWADALPRTRAGRVMRLDLLARPPAEGVEGVPHYTAAEIAADLATAGEVILETEASRAAFLAWVEGTLATGRAMLDDDGMPRSIAALARTLGYSREWTYKLLLRFRPEADPGTTFQTRPRWLDEKVITRLRAADPRRFDARAGYRWLVDWLWPRDPQPDVRSLKGWRVQGLADIEAGRDTLHAAFERGRQYLVGRAPAIPVAPTPAELAMVASLPPLKAADQLGVTLTQLEAARAAQDRR